MSTRENIRLIARAPLVSLRPKYFIFIGYLKTRGRDGGGGGVTHAPLHKSRVAEAAVRECKFEQSNHQPYSPGLAPSDYHMFRYPTCVERYFGTTMSSKLLQRLGLGTKQTTFISKA